MFLMADPIVPLIQLQQALNSGPPIDPRDLDEGYAKMYDEPGNGKRYSYAKIIKNEVQAISIFGLIDPIDGIDCYSFGYAVSERHRGRGLAIEAVNKGLEDLRKQFSNTKMDRFYIEAVIDVTNSSSLRVAEKLFSEPGIPVIESYSGKPSLQFKKLITLK